MTLVDFVLYHILTIHSYPDTGISSLKAVDGIYPKVALYDILYPSPYTKKSKVALESTALNICVLSKIIEMLDEDNKDIINLLCLSLEYQLYYCVEHMTGTNSHIPTLSALIEGCINTLNLVEQVGGQIGEITAEEITTWFYSLRANLFMAINNDNLDLYSLIVATKTLSLLKKYDADYKQDEVITIQLLEILARRNELGLLENGPIDRRIAPLSYQLFAVETLLTGQRYSHLYTISEETLALFNKVFELSYRPGSNLLSFQKGSAIRYTAKDIGLLICSLDTISQKLSSKEWQSKLTSIQRQFYIELVLKFTKHHETTISKLLLDPKPGNANALPLLFPSKLLLHPPYPTINWQRYRQINLTQILLLCNGILDIHKSPQIDISPSYIDTFINILLGIFN